MRELPLFVYGTLRPGEINWPVAAPLVTGHEPATLHGHALYLLDYPCVVGVDGNPHDDAGGVDGDLLWLRPDGYDEAIASLDRFEVHQPDDPDGSLYVREVHAVATASADAVDAWVYVAGRELRHQLTPERRIAEGRWSAG